MSIECGECEHDLRGGHSPDCSRYVPFREDDVILHRPSGEKWVVNRMVGKTHIECKGWPKSQALVSDCELVERPEW